jgi:hypothetical protein
LFPKHEPNKTYTSCGVKELRTATTLLQNRLCIPSSSSSDKKIGRGGGEEMGCHLLGFGIGTP